MPIIRTFLDSGILLAAFKGDHVSHVAAREIIDDPHRQLLVSDLVRLEILPKAIFHKQTEEAGFYEEFFASVGEIATTDQGTVDRALGLAKLFGLNAIDACLADAAINLAADEFMTTERTGKPFFQITGVSTKFISIAI